MLRFSDVPSLITLLILISPAATSAQDRLPPTRPSQQLTDHRQLAVNVNKALLHFEENQGQSAKPVRFLARGSDYTLFLTPTEAVFAFLKETDLRAARPLKSKGSRQGSKNLKMTALRMRLVGANARPQITGVSTLPGKANYLLGNDPAQWRTDIATYGKVRYRQVYPGIDLEYYGNQRQLEYDFVVSPGTDVRRIGLAFSGAQNVCIEPSGDLRVSLAGGAVRWHKPVAYQEVNGKRVPVAGKYARRGDRQIGFDVAKYDRAKPLVIDPVLIYATFLGGALRDEGFAVTTDTAGSVYVAGRSYSTDFPTKTPIQSTNHGVANAFVAKLSADGSQLLYATYIGGGSTDWATGIVVDKDGNACITGIATSDNFPVTFGAYQTVYGGGFADAFVTKLNAAGNRFIFSTYVGGSDDDEAEGIAMDSTGDVYIVGLTHSSDFPASAFAFQKNRRANFDAFVTKLRADGGARRYSTFLGGTNDDEATSIAVDAVGNAYVTGKTTSVDFPKSSDGYQQTLKGSTNAFFAKLNTNASQLLYGTYLGGSGSDIGASIALDSQGAVVVGGETSSTDFPVTAAAYQPQNKGHKDGFVTKFKADGSGLLFSTYLGGGQDDGVAGLALDSADNVYLVGTTLSTDFPAANNAYQKNNRGNRDVFVAKLSADGSLLPYATYFGGAGFDYGYGLALDAARNLYVVGIAGSVDFPFTPQAYQKTLKGHADAFLAKLRLFSRSDFNDDGKPDLLLHNQTTGAIVCWFYDGITRTGASYLYGALDLHWQIVGVEDFNGDGQSDLVLQNQTTGAVSVWFYRGTQRIGTAVLAAPLGTDWKVVGVADFNGDGKPDLLLQNQVTGAIVCWFYNGTTRTGMSYIYPSPSTGNNRFSTDWKVVGNGDFNGDGKTDLLFQNQANGSISCWFMDGVTFLGGVYISPGLPLDWKLVGSADINGDGKPDLLFQNQANGSISCWFMDGTTRTGSAYIQNALPLQWKVTGAR